MSSELTQSSEIAAPIPLKLRGSCESCSVSKVRCDKAKPICSRCARRKIGCEYVATKRVGRKQSNRKASSSVTSPTGGHGGCGSKQNSVDLSQTMLAAITQSPSQALPPADMGMTLLGGSGDMDVDMFMSNVDNFDYSVFSTLTSTNTSSSVQTPSPQPLSSTATTGSLPVWDLFSDFFPLDPTLVTDLDGNTSAQEGAAIYDEFDDLFSTPSKDDGTKMDSSCRSTATPLFPDNDFTGLGDATFMDQLMTRPEQHNLLQSAQVSPMPTLDEPQQHVVTDIAAQPQPTEPTCGPCIVEALALMRQLFPDNPTKACSQSSSTPTRSSPQQPSFETITSQNEAVIDACITMLKCGCSADGYLLAVISLIVFKVLAWYAAAVHSRSESTAVSQRPRGTLVDDNYPDEFDATRVAAQCVLGKMHRVQHLVNQLSGKLKAKRLEGNGTVPLAGKQESRSLSSMGTLPVSGTMLEQLEVDLRKRLRALSLEIIGVLKRD